MFLTSVGQEIRELFLLRRVEQRVTQLSEVQRKSIRTYRDAAIRRLRVARDVGGMAGIGVALELFQQVGLFYVLAFLVSKNETLDAAGMSPESAFRMFEDTLSAAQISPPPEFARVKSVYLCADPLTLDQLPAEEALPMAADLDVNVRWLSSLSESRSPRDVRVARVVRLAVAGAVAFVALGWLVSWILSPANLAKGKRVFSSGSPVLSTAPAGAVDGIKSGPYGFHSSLEDSPWLSVDLGQRCSITRVKVFGRGDDTLDQSIPLSLEVSDDDRTYRAVAQRDTPFSADDPWVIEPTGLVARFVRLQTLRRSYLVLSEVEVYGRKVR
jgi:hypothetical protein